MHVYGARFPLAAKARRQVPDALVPAYREVHRTLGFERLVVVQPTAYGKDNRCTLAALAKALVAHAPQRMVWGSDWRHPMSTPDTMPDDAQLLDFLHDWASNKVTRRRIRVENPAQLYQF